MSSLINLLNHADSQTSKVDLKTLQNTFKYDYKLVVWWVTKTNSYIVEFYKD
jgi:anti-sigma-K factor RskA